MELIDKQAAIAFAISGLTRTIDGENYIRVREVRQSLRDMPSGNPEMDITDNLKAFIEKEKKRENRTLGDFVKQWILEGILDGNCKITGSATDHKAKKMFVEFTFYAEEQNG